MPNSYSEVVWAFVYVSGIHFNLYFSIDSTLEKGNEEVKLTSYVHNRPPYYLINIYIHIQGVPINMGIQ